MTQLPLFDVDSSWSPPDILPEWQNADIIAIDLETNDPNLKDSGPGWPWRGGHVAGYAIALGYAQRPAEAFYLPVGHEQGGNLDGALVRRYMASIAGAQIPKVFHNSLYDLGWMWADGIEQVRGPLHDTQVAAGLLDENRMSYSLDNLTKDWLGTGKDEEHLIKAGAVWGYKSAGSVKSNMWRMPPKHVGPYAEADARETLALWHYTQERLARENLLSLYDLEMRLIPLLVEMRKRGIRVDESRAEQAREEVLNLEKDQHRLLKKKYDVTVDVWSADSVAKAFDKVGLSYPYTPKGSPSFTKEFLESHPHELPHTIRQIRKYSKTINTFIDGAVGRHNHNGRIHSQLHPMKSDIGGTVSGRLSSSDPNLQQATGHDPVLAPIVRGLLLPEDGEAWGALDYSSQEPRLTLHYAFLTGQEGAADAVEQFQRDPRTDYHQMVADICGISRKQAKPINLGLPYGMGEAKLCHSLGLPISWMVKVNDRWEASETRSETYPCYEVAGPEGKAILDQFHERLPYMKGLMNTTSNLAAQRGYIRTLLGRRCRFDLWEPKRGKGLPVSKEQAEEKATHDKRWSSIRRAYTHKALNRLIQGSAADQTKMAMVQMWDSGIVPILQMHDEIDLSVGSEKQWRDAEEIMRNCVDLKVPVIVDCEFGSNWGNAKKSWKEYTNEKLAG